MHSSAATAPVTRARSTSAPAMVQSPYSNVSDFVPGGVNASGVNLSMPFSRAELESRLRSVRHVMKARGIDLLVLTSPESIYYLSCYQTPGNPFTALVVPREAPMMLFTRELEGTNAKYRTAVE